MRCIIYCFILLLGTACGGSQEATTTEAPRTERRTRESRDPQTAAQRQTERMQTELGLNDDQTTRVGEINLRYAERGRRLRDQAGGDRRGALQAGRTLQSERNAELKTVLTAEQYAQLEKMQARDRERRRAQMQQRRGGGRRY